MSVELYRLDSSIPSECDKILLLLRYSIKLTQLLRFIFAREPTLDILSTSFPTASSLQELFPKLVAVFSRWTDPGSRDTFGTMTRAESQVTVYQPVRISALVQTSILGDNQQITRWGGNIVKLSKTHLAEEYSTTKDG
jgi:hypothetical protein